MRSKYLFCYPVKTCNEKTFLFHLNRVIRLSQHVDFDPASSAATITRRSAQPRPTNFTKTANADTRAPHPINNGRMRLNGTSRPYFPTYPPQSMDRTSCAPTLGLTLSSTGLAFTTHFPMRFSRTLQRTLSTPHSSFTRTTNTGSHSVTCCTSYYKTTNVYGNSNDIGFYVGDEDSIKGGSVVYMPCTHRFLKPGNGHRILISDIQLLQWYSRRRDIRRNSLPYSEVQNAVMDLLANRETPILRADSSQLLITPALGPDNAESAPPPPLPPSYSMPYRHHR